MKLVIDEAETQALKRHLADGARLATSRIALVEVPRVTALADPSATVREATELLLDDCVLVDVTDPLLRHAAEVASLRVRSLDAIHLASALRVEPDEFVSYDGRLNEAATEHGLTVVSPA